MVDRAGIEYGRIDYGVVDGKIRVWGINTNPTVMSDRLRMARWRRHRQKLFVERYRGGLDALDTPQGPPIPLTFPDFPHQSSPGSS